MIRVVLDTNILVSAVLQPLGAPARVFQLALSGAVEFCISAKIYAEYEEVIRRPRFRRSGDEIEAVLRAIRETAIWAEPVEEVRGCADPDDDMFLECAQAAAADYIVTGNLRHFPESWKETRVVSPKSLLERLSDAT